MFKNFTCKDLTDQIEPIINHWKSENVQFDAVYPGYLGTTEQINQVKDIFRLFKKDGTLIFVDPVMADNGKLYPAFDMEYVKKNTELCAEADIIVPNITEASLMTGKDDAATFIIDTTCSPRSALTGNYSVGNSRCIWKGKGPAGSCKCCDAESFTN